MMKKNQFGQRLLSVVLLIMISTLIIMACSASKRVTGSVANTKIIDVQCAFYTDDYNPFYLNMYTEADDTESEMPLDSWLTYSRGIVKENIVYDVGIFEGMTSYRIKILTEVEGRTVFYLKSFSVTNGTNTPIKIIVDKKTDLDDLGFFAVQPSGGVTIKTVQIEGEYALEFEGESMSQYGNTGIEIMFPLSGETDLSGGDYKAEFEIYAPSEIAGESVDQKKIVMKGPMKLSDISKSLIQTGNNYRIKNLIKKAKKGEDITIAYLGGSITEGHNASKNELSYAYRSYEAFKDFFAKGDGSQVKFVNAGMAGTPSTLGMIRYDRDVLEVAGTLPDLVVIEFAVNDFDDPTKGAAYESLVLDILNSKNKPAVILLFSVFKDHGNLQDRLKPIGVAYDLPMISIKDALVPDLTSGKIAYDDYFSDIYHPTSEGHRIMAECIRYYFKTVKKGKADKSDIKIPSKPVVGTQFVGVKMISSTLLEPGITINRGSFTSVDTNLGTFKYAPKTKTFPDNWYKDKTDENKPFVISLKCKNFLLVHKKATNFGIPLVKVDGEIVDVVINHAGAWNNPWTTVLIDKKEATLHTIEISMESEDASKNFAILAFGYTE